MAEDLAHLAGARHIAFQFWPDMIVFSQSVPRPSCQLHNTPKYFWGQGSLRLSALTGHKSCLALQIKRYKSSVRPKRRLQLLYAYPSIAPPSPLLHHQNMIEIL